MRACPVFIINLDRSPERLAAMAAQLDRLGLVFTRIPAIDGRSLGPPPWPDFDARDFDRCVGKAPNPNELGCYLSHVAALRALLAGEAEAALILEDDAVLADDLPAVLDALLERRDWDMAKLSGFHSGVPRTNAMLGTGHRLVTFLGRSRGAAAYLVTRRAAEAYLARLLPMRVPYDHEFDQAWIYGIRVRGVQPFPVATRDLDSTIGYEDPRKKPWYRRTRVLVHRLAVEARRLLHYLFADRAWMSYRD